MAFTINIKLERELSFEQFKKDIIDLVNVNRLDINQIIWSDQNNDDYIYNIAINKFALNQVDTLEKTKEINTLLINLGIPNPNKPLDIDSWARYEGVNIYRLPYKEISYFANEINEEMLINILANDFPHKNIDQMFLSFESLSKHGSARTKKLIEIITERLVSSDDTSFNLKLFQAFEKNSNKEKIKQNIQILEQYLNDENNYEFQRNTLWKQGLFRLKNGLNLTDVNSITSEELKQYIQNSNISAISNFIKNGLDVNILNNNQDIILRNCKDNDLLNLLLDYGFKINPKTLHDFILRIDRNSYGKENLNAIFNYHNQSTQALSIVLSILKDNNYLTDEVKQLLFKQFLEHRAYHTEETIDILLNSGFSPKEFDFLKIYERTKLETNETVIKKLIAHGSELSESSLLRDIVYNNRDKPKLTFMLKMGTKLNGNLAYKILMNSPTKAFTTSLLKKVNWMEEVTDSNLGFKVFPFWAATSNFLSEIKTTVGSSNFDITKKTSDGMNFLLFSCKYLRGDKKEIIKPSSLIPLLLKFKESTGKTINLNDQDKYGNTIFHYLFKGQYSTGHSGLINVSDIDNTFSLNDNINFNIQDNEGNTPLHILFIDKAANWQLIINKIIVFYGDTINWKIQNNNGVSLEDLIAQNKDNVYADTFTQIEKFIYEQNLPKVDNNKKIKM